MRYYDPCYNITFRKVFAHPELLKSFLNAMLPLEGDQMIQSIEYLTSAMVPEIPDARYSAIDVRCWDKNGKQFLVDIQLVWSEEFNMRVQLKNSSVYISSLSNQNELKFSQPVYFMNIINAVFETDLPDDEYYHYYRLVHDKHTEKVIEGLHIAFIELPKFKPRNTAEKKMQDLWLRFLTEINENTRKAPKELLENPLVCQAVNLMEEEGMTDGERYAYEKNLDNVRVEQAILRETKEKAQAEGRAEGRAEGLAQGKKLGIAEGKELGIAENKMETAKKMLSLGMSKDVILQITGLTDEELHEINSEC